MDVAGNVEKAMNTAANVAQNVKKAVNMANASKNVETAVNVAQNIKKAVNVANASKNVETAVNAVENVKKAVNVANASKNVETAVNAVENVKKAVNVANASKNVETITNAVENATNVANASKNVERAVNALENATNVANASKNVERAVNAVENATNVVQNVEKAANAVENATNVAQNVEKAANAIKEPLSFAKYFDYTRAEFWSGKSYSYWMLLVATIFFGFFGMDHFLLRSPTTGVLKILVNLLSFGLWWFYDIVQVVKEEETVRKYGLSAPLVGPLGIGAGMFVEKDEEATAKKPWRWILYVLALALPVTFGVDMLVAGNTQGAIMKFVSTFLPFMWPFLALLAVTNIGRAVLMPKTLFTEGIDHVFPYSWINGPKGASVLGPKDLPAGGADSCGESGLLKTVVSAIVAKPAEAVGAAVTAAADAAGAMAGAASAAAGAVTEVVDTVKGVAVPVAATVGTLGRAVPSAVGQIDALSQSVVGNLQKYTTPEGLKEVAARQAAATLQTGGGLLTNGPSSLVSQVLFLSLSAILLLGLYRGFQRLNPDFSLFRKKEDDGRQRNDTPPRASRV